MPLLKMQDGASIHVRVIGRGKPVVLLHGFALDSLQWLPLIAPYLSSYRFFLPDWRGHGQSELGEFRRDQALNLLHSDIDSILRHFQLRDVILGAYSMGAIIGLKTVLHDQESRIARYLHIEAGPCFNNGMDWSFGFSSEIRKQAVALLVLWDETLHERPDDPQVMAAYKSLIHQLARLAFPQNWVKTVLGAIPVSLLGSILPDPRFTHELFSYLLDQGFDYRQDLASLKIPGIVMSGRQSTYFPWESAQWMYENWEQSQVVYFEQSGHGLMYSEPIRFRKAFRCFLQGDLENLETYLSQKSWLRLRAAI